VSCSGACCTAISSSAAISSAQSTLAAALAPPPAAADPPPPSSLSAPAVNRAQTIAPHGAATPRLGDAVFVAPSATVLGDVTLGAGSSIWYGAVLRGDVNSITVGPGANIQDNAVVHVARHNPEGRALSATIGARATVGHGATIHAAAIGEGALVGMGATVMDGAVVEAGAVVAAGALVPPGAVVKRGTVWAGAPARLLRDLLPGEAAFVASAAEGLAALAALHAEENAKGFAEVELDAARRADRRERDPEHDAQNGIERDVETRELTHVATST
jgi:carbonic anhydrase/acetyltransferase-like protein (isoleucine patch superfamily)